MSLDADDLDALARKPASVSGEAGSTTARSADDVARLNALAAGATALASTNDQGGARSLWNRLRPSKAIQVDPS